MDRNSNSALEAHEVHDALNIESGNKLLNRFETESFFNNRNYLNVSPISIENRDKDTVFITASVQTALQLLKNGDLTSRQPLYVAQPVIRTQFRDLIDEGLSVAFTNISTIKFDSSVEDHENMIFDWMELFQKLGLDLSKLTTREKDYIRKWGDLIVQGRKTFYSYGDLELGDSSRLSISENNELPIKTITDIGFGLERLRWILRGGSYFDLPMLSNNELAPAIKGECSTLALLVLNGIKPSNKGAGYRIRQFSKRIVTINNENSELIKSEIEGWLEYWNEWSNAKLKKHEAMAIINKESERNVNRLVLETLLSNGISDGQSIDINLPRSVFIDRLITAGLGPQLDQIFSNLNLGVK